MDPMALSIVDIKAHGNSVTERATILAALRCPPNQAFPLSLFPREESGCLRAFYCGRTDAPHYWRRGTGGRYRDARADCGQAVTEGRYLGFTRSINTTDRFTLNTTSGGSKAAVNYAHDARWRKRRSYAAFAQSLLVVLLRPEVGSPCGCERESSTLRSASIRRRCAGTST
jgi:hypothetical protein